MFNMDLPAAPRWGTWDTWGATAALEQLLRYDSDVWRLPQDRTMRGRDKEFEVVLRMLRAAEAGRGGILLVEGEPGIGKSRFLEEPSAADDGGGRGHGLPMMRTFMDYVALEPGVGSTTVRMSRIVR
jgi:hypothetical protein